MAPPYFIFAAATFLKRSPHSLSTGTTCCICGASISKPLQEFSEEFSHKLPSHQALLSSLPPYILCLLLQRSAGEHNR